jgi:hypothetical protein
MEKQKMYQRPAYSQGEEKQGLKKQTNMEIMGFCRASKFFDHHFTNGLWFIKEFFFFLIITKRRRIVKDREVFLHSFEVMPIYTVCTVNA